MFCHQDQNYKLLSTKMLHLSYLAAIFAVILDLKKSKLHPLVLGTGQYILAKDNLVRSEAGPLDYTIRQIREVAPPVMPTLNLRND